MGDALNLWRAGAIMQMELAPARAPPRRGRVRSTGYSRSRRDVRRDVPPTAAAASRPAGAAHDGLPASLVAVAGSSPWPAAADTEAAPAPHRSDRSAVANSSRPPGPPHAVACRRHPDR